MLERLADTYERRIANGIDGQNYEDSIADLRERAAEIRGGDDG